MSEAVLGYLESFRKLIPFLSTFKKQDEPKKPDYTFSAAILVGGRWKELEFEEDDGPAYVQRMNSAKLFISGRECKLNCNFVMELDGVTEIDGYIKASGIFEANIATMHYEINSDIQQNKAAKTGVMILYIPTHGDSYKQPYGYMMTLSQSRPNDDRTGYLFISPNGN